MNYHEYNEISHLDYFNWIAITYVVKKYKNAQINYDIIYVNMDDPILDLNDIAYTLMNLNQRFLIVYLGLYSKTMSHANVLLFEKIGDKIYVERYEPGYINNINDDLLDFTVKNAVEPYGIIFKEFGCIIGPQAAYDDTFGYCQTYVTNYLSKRLSGENVVSIKRDMLTMKEDDLRETIENTMKSIMKSDIITKQMKVLFSIYNFLSKSQKNDINNYLKLLLDVLIKQR